MSAGIGLALGGGGARGLAHLGVLKALEENQVPIQCITGTSAGAIIGAMYAQHPVASDLIAQIRESIAEGISEPLQIDCLKAQPNSTLLEQLTRKIKRRIIVNLAQSRRALLTDIRLRDMLSRFVREGRIEDTKIPFATVATSLHTGKEIIFTKGDILTAVAASASISGFFPPLDYHGDLLTDGAVSCPVPVMLLRDMGAEFTVGVEICTREYLPLQDASVIEIIARAEMIESIALSRMMVKTADIAICPDTKDIHWSDFSRMDELIHAGLESARRKIPDIQNAIQKRRPWYRRPGPIPFGLSHALKAANKGRLFHKSVKATP